MNLYENDFSFLIHCSTIFLKKVLNRIGNVYSFSFTCKKGGHQVQYLLSLVSRFMVYHFSLVNKWARESFGKKSWLKYCYCHRAKSTLFAKDIESLILREGNIMGYCKINYQAIILPHEPHFAKNSWCPTVSISTF